MIHWFTVVDGMGREIGLQVRHFRDAQGWGYQMRLVYRDSQKVRRGKTREARYFTNRRFRDEASARECQRTKTFMLRRYPLWG